mmetsp:Transcript_17202/g.15211  ORF Transcript_17202/g.15211 Transcript_17202/m.15211 type:complete len:113 (+) Transcript_17202:137-475(+)
MKLRIIINKLTKLKIGSIFNENKGSFNNRYDKLLVPKRRININRRKINQDLYQENTQSDKEDSLEKVLNESLLFEQPKIKRTFDPVQKLSKENLKSVWELGSMQMFELSDSQ